MRSTTDPESRLFEKAKGHEGKLAYLDQGRMPITLDRAGTTASSHRRAPCYSVTSRRGTTESGSFRHDARRGHRGDRRARRRARRAPRDLRRRCRPRSRGRFLRRGPLLRLAWQMHRLVRAGARDLSPEPVHGRKRCRHPSTGRRRRPNHSYRRHIKQRGTCHGSGPADICFALEATGRPSLYEYRHACLEQKRAFHPRSNGTGSPL